MGHRAEGVVNGNPNPKSHTAMPGPRYLSSAALAGAVKTPTRSRGVLSPRVLLFGGYDGVRYLDDLWELELNELGNRDGEQDEEEEHAALCTWRRKAGTTARKKWDESCLAMNYAAKQAQLIDPDKSCDLKDLLIQSWCDGRWQSIGQTWLSGLGGT